MNSPAISTSGLGKRYEIGRRRDLHGRLTESLWSAMAAPFRRHPAVSKDWIWALREVSFEVPRGEVVGVIGRNGSGKSTLLKVLSRITEPTMGLARLEGRVGSLLEVGTGFHPELTGRENVFMSGAVLGMRRAEINRRFDEIVDFAGVEPFLDTPIKRFSSGMQVRLGFAVAAHMDPEILFIDEVLAVGDAEFQRRCLGKMSELGQGGRTILFVSHSMPAVLRLCKQALLLDHGRLVELGRASDVVHAYMRTGASSATERIWSEWDAPGDDVAKLRAIRLLPHRVDGIDEFDIREPIDIEVEYSTSGRASTRPLLNVDAYNEEDVCVFSLTDQTSQGWRKLPTKSGIIRSTCRLPGNFLAEGRLSLNVAVVTYNPLVGHAVELNAVSFRVVDRSDGDGAKGMAAGDWPGVVRPLLDWRVDRRPVQESDMGERANHS